MRALFVCTGNSCRSVMAEFMFNHIARELGLDGFRARSCGIAAERYFPVPPEVVAELSARGITEVKHVPQLVGRPILGWAESVYAMTARHLEIIKDLFPDHSRKMSLFLDSAGLGPADVDDPIGQAPEVYAQCAAQIEKAVNGLLAPHAKPARKTRP